jgi:hypothetical protein
MSQFNNHQPLNNIALLRSLGNILTCMVYKHLVPNGTESALTPIRATNSSPPLPHLRVLPCAASKHAARSASAPHRDPPADLSTEMLI